jgi:hypothetical protein
MNNMDFHQFTQPNSPDSNQIFAKQRTIIRLKRFAYKCEGLRLHALAAYAFRTLVMEDWENRDQYMGHFLYNKSLAGKKGIVCGFSPVRN